jgi:hypothetical protein
LAFTQSTLSNPFSGLNFLKSLREEEENLPGLSLLFALENQQLSSDDNNFATNYFESIESPAPALSLLLLARHLAFEGRENDSKSLFVFLSESFPQSVEYFSDNEKLCLKPSKRPLPEEETPFNIWEKMKAEKGYVSRSMDELLQLTGLKSVKKECIQMFSLASTLKYLDPKIRAKNIISFNKVFAGNPGTGKTVVARLLAGIFCDSGLRPKGTFQETTAQQLKEAGVDKFREMISSAMDGVLFIDEAYDLHPAKDPKGQAIVAELLTASENYRDRITFILAGYQKDIQENLFSYNDGFRSRFTDILFDDYNETELKEICAGMIVDRGWAYDERIPVLVSKRLVLGAGKRGFGNARACRSMLEVGFKSAFTRENFDVLHMFLSLEDIVGDHPNTNLKLKRLLAELDEMTGWNSIKLAVSELMSLAIVNYDRSLQGLASLPFIMNRMFLGNPGLND